MSDPIIRKHDCFPNSEFEDLNLEGSRFTNVNLSGAKFHDINFTEVSFTAANLGGTHFKHIGPMPNPDGTQERQKALTFEEGMLCDSTFLRMDLSGVKIIECDLTGMTINGILVTDLIAAWGQKSRKKPTIHLRPADPERDFAELATLLTTYNDEVTSEADLKEEYAADHDRILQQAAFDERGTLMGFYWASQSRLEEGRVYASLIVKPEFRHSGVGHYLAVNMEHDLRGIRAKKLRLTVLDNDPIYKAFAEMRGYTALQHLIGMELDLTTFDEQPYLELIDRLKGKGFRFTSMEELCNTEEAQRKLYELNDTASAETMGGQGEHPWASFEDFQKRVCQSDWYIPGGQIVVIDTATGNWAAMSAITRMHGTDYAYNLFTGVNWSYRGRQLAQAVKAVALCYARDVLKVCAVRTHHNADNLPMIHIDRKFGYVERPGHYTMEKIFTS